ncbi:uncharacterized protein ACA1_127090, partial [Acanthamoeba castellanii str. Neff]
MVREGQVLEAVVVAPIATARRHSRRGHILPKPTTLATFTVVSIQRFDKPRSSAAAGEKSKWATPRLRGGMVLAAAEAGESALTARVESFTVRLDHSVPVRLRCGSEPYLIIHSAARPYRVEKVLKCWDKDGQEVEVSKAEIVVPKGTSTLVQVKPI